ncbi:MAG: NAD(P)H-hydrate dehydratase [Fidelibacterota bacterium]|jgi:NAD(P)H-hydrate epimerase|tara:strand:- start:241 stop:1194 length:954 start_codon:yes stop_codon:yes gene_type:complete
MKLITKEQADKLDKIAIDKHKILGTSLDWSLLEDSQINSMIQNIELRSHKYNQGKVLILAGSVGMTGAAYLSTMSALRSGAGITKTFAPSSLNSIYEQKITEGMTIPCDDLGNGYFIEDNYDIIMNHIDWCDVIIIGPGLGSNLKTSRLVSKLIKVINKPIVIDADGFQPFYENLELFKKIKSKFVITPHLGEFSRLTGINNKLLEEDLPKNIDYFMNDFKGTLLLKNVPSFVASKSKGCVNSTGNPGLATAGSGDVLTGIIASFIAQGNSIEEAAKIGMYIHGKAGDELSHEISQHGLIASDLLNKVARVISNYEL